MNKIELRKKCSLLRKTLNQKRASDVIVSKILSLETFLAAKNILIFYPLKYEINLLKLTEAKGKNFYLPKTDGGNLLICPFEGELIKSSFNVLEPVTSPVSPDIIDLAFIPALCADKNLNRIGYGKGYYDRLFSNPLFKAEKVVVINKELVVEKIEADIFDKKADLIITD